MNRTILLLAILVGLNSSMLFSQSQSDSTSIYIQKVGFLNQDDWFGYLSFDNTTFGKRIISLYKRSEFQPYRAITVIGDGNGTIISSENDSINSFSPGLQLMPIDSASFSTIDNNFNFLITNQDQNFIESISRGLPTHLQNEIPMLLSPIIGNDQIFISEFQQREPNPERTIRINNPIDIYPRLGQKVELSFSVDELNNSIKIDSTSFFVRLAPIFVTYFDQFYCYKGSIKNSRPHGFGVLFTSPECSDNGPRLIAEFENGIINKKAIKLDHNSLVATGNYTDGYKTDKWTYYSSLGFEIHSREYSQGVPIDGPILIADLFSLPFLPDSLNYQPVRQYIGVVENGVLEGEWIPTIIEHKVENWKASFSSEKLVMVSPDSDYYLFTLKTHFRYISVSGPCEYYDNSGTIVTATNCHQGGIVNPGIFTQGTCTINYTNGNRLQGACSSDGSFGVVGQASFTGPTVGIQVVDVKENGSFTYTSPNFWSTLTDDITSRTKSFFAGGYVDLDWYDEILENIYSEITRAVESNDELKTFFDRACRANSPACPVDSYRINFDDSGPPNVTELFAIPQKRDFSVSVDISLTAWGVSIQGSRSPASWFTTGLELLDENQGTSDPIIQNQVALLISERVRSDMEKIERNWDTKLQLNESIKLDCRATRWGLDGCVPSPNQLSPHVTSNTALWPDRPQGTYHNFTYTYTKYPNIMEHIWNQQMTETEKQLLKQLKKLQK